MASPMGGRGDGAGAMSGPTREQVRDAIDTMLVVLHAGGGGLVAFHPTVDEKGREPIDVVVVVAEGKARRDLLAFLGPALRRGTTTFVRTPRDDGPEVA